MSKPGVLHLDDNEAFLELFSLTFGKYFEITSASRFCQALDLLKTKEYDVLITDYEMTDINGIEVIQQLRENLIDIPVVFLTGQGNEEVAREAFLIGASDYFTKDFNVIASKEKLANSVRMILDKKNAEKELVYKEEYFQSLIKNASDIIAIWDPDGKILYTSLSTKRLLDYSPDELKGKNIHDYIHPDDLELFREGMRKSIENPVKPPLTAHCRFRNKSGQWRHLEGVSRILIDSTGEIRIVANARDVTDRKEAEDSLSYRLKFEKIILKILSDFINLKDNGNAGAMENALNLLISSIDAMEISLFKLSPDLSRIIEQFSTAGNESIRGKQIEEILSGRQKFFYNQLCHFESIILSAPKDLPSQAEGEREWFAEKGFTPLILIPLQSDGVLHGILMICSEKEHTPQWPAELKHLLKFVADIMVMAMKRKEAEEELKEQSKMLREKEARLKAYEKEIERREIELLDYRELLDVIPDIVFQIDTDGYFTYINNAAKILGYRPQDLIGKHFSNIIHPEDLPTVSREEVLKRFNGIKTGDDKAPKLFNERRTGRRMTDGLELRILKNQQRQNGALHEESQETKVRIVSSGRYDISQDEDQKKFLGSLGIIKINPDGDDAINASEYQSLLNVIPDIVFRIDPQGNFTYISEKIKILGYKPSELIGRHFSSILSEDVAKKVSREEVLKKYSGKITGEKNAPKIFDERRTGKRKTECLEIPILKADGAEQKVTITLENDKCILGEVSTSGFFDKSIIESNKKFLGTVGIIRDITTRKKSEEQLMKKNRELDDYTYTVSHELKNPINLIKGFLMAIKQDPGLFEHHYDQVIRQADQLLCFIDNLLKLSRAGRTINKKIYLEPKPMIEKIFSNFKPANLNSKLIIATDIPPIYGDPLSLRQVFANIISNSFNNFDPCKDQSVIEVECRSDKENTHLIFRDNGVGIEPRFSNKIFHPGFTNSRDKGSGFGLAIVKKIIEGHNGSITLTSEGHGRGVEIQIIIPQNQKEQN